MTARFEVPEPILNPPFEEPAWHWFLEEGQEPEKRPGRRPAGYFYRDPHAPQQTEAGDIRGEWVELRLVNLIRERIKAWRDQGWPGVTRTSLELLNYWRRDGRQHRLFFGVRFTNPIFAPPRYLGMIGGHEPGTTFPGGVA